MRTVMKHAEKPLIKLLLAEGLRSRWKRGGKQFIFRVSLSMQFGLAGLADR